MRSLSESNQTAGHKRAIRSTDLDREKDAAWCTIEAEGRVFQAFVVHVGRGKFLILKDNQENSYAGTVVDASSILACDTKR